MKALRLLPAILASTLALLGCTTISTTVEIDAPPDAVWEVLTDFDAYEQWNPFIIRSSGRAEVGSRLENTMAPPGGSEMSFRPVIRTANPGEELRWLGRFGVPGIFDGEHIFFLEESAPGQTLVTHEEEMRGILVPFMRGQIHGPVLDGFELMNRALKERVEEHAQARK